MRKKQIQICREWETDEKKTESRKAHIGYDTISRSEFYSKTSAKYRVQNVNLNQFEIKAKDTFKKDERITTNFETSNDEDDNNKTNLDTKLSKSEGHLPLKEKH